jgi:hypothetical protein
LLVAGMHPRLLASLAARVHTSHQQVLIWPRTSATLPSRGAKRVKAAQSKLYLIDKKVSGNKVTKNDCLINDFDVKRCWRDKNSIQYLLRMFFFRNNSKITVHHGEWILVPSESVKQSHSLVLQNLNTTLFAWFLFRRNFVAFRLQ